MANETINGKPVTEEQIVAWAAEAEAGYDVTHGITITWDGIAQPGRRPPMAT